jgi:hypothetical protein
MAGDNWNGRAIAALEMHLGFWQAAIHHGSVWVNSGRLGFRSGAPGVPLSRLELADVRGHYFCQLTAN